MSDSRAMSWCMVALCALFAVFLLAGCNGKPATPTRPARATPGDLDALPAVEATGVIVGEQGGVLTLRDGAEVTVPSQALIDKGVGTWRREQNGPAVPAPRSLIGHVYQFRLDGTRLTGPARFSLPMPAILPPDQFDVAPYRWTGQAWERLPSRIDGNAMVFGASQTGVFAIQAQWRMADASLALLLPSISPGQSQIPLAVAGQYRYTALPALAQQQDYVEATLRLKQDTSGGAGQVSGDESRDRTVTEAILWFKPDLGQTQGVIDFSFVFQVAPLELGVSPGATGRFYASLTVADAAAPTRRLSSGIAYTQILPIQIEGREVVAPDLADSASLLRWHVRLDGKPLLDKQPANSRLTLDDVLARGGLGEYRIALEIESGGQWVPVSNEVIVNLRIEPTATIQATSVITSVAMVTPTPAISQPTPTLAAGTPTVVPPATPTRRTPPSGQTPVVPGTPSVTPTSTAGAATPTGTRPAWAAVFWADRYQVATGECTLLHWNVQNVQAVYFDGASVTGVEDRRVCPTQTTTYRLSVRSADGSYDRTVTIALQSADQPTFEYMADAFELNRGQCTKIHWATSDVTAVYFNGTGVAGTATQEVCPDTTTTYELRVQTGSTVVTRRLTITVVAADTLLVKFWAEQYALAASGCTTLYWAVENVQAVYLETPGGRSGVTGSGSIQVCPHASLEQYVLQVTGTNSQQVNKPIRLTTGQPVLGTNEVIVLGLVNEVTFVSDLDPSNGGDQPGWRLHIDGVTPLYTGAGNCCEVAVTLPILQAQTNEAGNWAVDWPIHPGQLVEYRAVCPDTSCYLQGTYYVKLRSD